MIRSKFILFARNVLAQHGGELEAGTNAPVERYVMTGDAEALTNSVFDREDDITTFAIYYENFEWREAAMELTRYVNDESGEVEVEVSNYSKQAKHLVPYLLCDEDRIACGG